MILKLLSIELSHLINLYFFSNLVKSVAILHYFESNFKQNFSPNCAFLLKNIIVN